MYLLNKIWGHKMILSMTGYGRAQQLLHGKDITVEIKSVNSRYFEYSSRMPRSCSFLDDKLKKLLNESISRGKVELGLTIINVEGDDTVVEANFALAQEYKTALAEIAKRLEIEDDTTTSAIARFPDIFISRKSVQNEDELWADIALVTQDAISNFINMRGQEGEKLKSDILSRLEFLQSAIIEIEKTSADRVEKYTQKLQERLKSILEDKNIDDSRILTEAAIFADKTAVDEETVRLNSHIKQYQDILSLQEPVGRKLDFLTQELNRETNTIGSKAQEISITRLVVDMKSEIEKIREQVQNIE